MIKAYIQKEYEQFYKGHHLHIKSIDLALSPNTQIAQIKLQDIKLENQNFFADGKVRIHFVFHNKKYSHVMQYHLDASLDVAFAKTKIKKSQNITKQDIVIKHLLLSEIKATPIGLDTIDMFSAKMFIPAQTFITIHQVEPKILIYKNESFLATYKEGNILIELVLIARENGAKDAIIEALNPQTKKIVRIRVLANGTGEIL